MIDRFFNISQRSTSYKKEFLGGLTTFLAMSYIVFVHPSILSDTGMNHEALIVVTCLATFLGTLLVGLYANMPLAMAPGLGLNTFFTYSLVIGNGVEWQTALGVVFISGILFLMLSVIGIREKVVQAIPILLRLVASQVRHTFLT